MDNLTLTPGPQFLASNVRPVDVTVSPAHPEQMGEYRSNVFTLDKGRLFFSTTFDDTAEAAFHVWYGNTKNGPKQIVFSGENEKTFISTLDMTPENNGEWKLVCFDSSGAHIDGRYVIVNDGQCFVAHYPKSRIKAEGTICSGIEDGEPLELASQHAPSIGRVVFYNRLSETPEAGDLVHIWYGPSGNPLRQEATVLEGKNGIYAYSSMFLSDDSAGYWKAVAYDLTGGYLCYSDFELK